jgi:hypothetical protein
MTVGGTKETYNVDIYSGNHPFYTQARDSQQRGPLTRRRARGEAPLRRGAARQAAHAASGR